MDANERARFEGAKRASTFQMLFRVARRLNETAIERVRATPGFESLRPAHTNLLAHIDLDGTRLTDVAARAGISKQAVGQLVDELVAMGGLERVPDPQDGRAKLIRFARRDGAIALMHGLGVLKDLESELELELGVRSIRELRRALLRLDAWLDAPESDDPAP